MFTISSLWKKLKGRKREREIGYILRNYKHSWCQNTQLMTEKGQTSVYYKAVKIIGWLDKFFTSQSLAMVKHRHSSKINI